MKQGRCALCLKERKSLCESHLISEGIYWRAGESRVVMTPQIFVSISNQVKDYLLCEDCEQRFGDAENYVLPLVRQDEKSFPLLETLRSSEPLGSGQTGSLVYSAPAVGIDTGRLAYFALSVFWRASAHIWKTLNSQIISMPLGSWEEPIRKYLNGETGFPDGVALRVTVCTDDQSQGMVFAPVEWSNEIYTGYDMAVLGLYFTLVVGVQPGAKEWNLCCVNSEQRVFFLEDCSETFRAHYRDLRGRARIAKNLIGEAG